MTATAEAPSAQCVPTPDASAPQTALPMARQPCVATRFIDTALARTHAGALLCVPADRLAKTYTHAIPAQNAPTSASAVMPVSATRNVATAHNCAPDVTVLFIDCRSSSPGIEIAPTIAPIPKLADSRPKPPAPRPS